MYQLAAEESVLQMVPRRAALALREFIQSRTRFDVSKLVGIPAVLKVLEEWKGQYSSDLMDLLEWLCKRAENNLKEIIKYPAPQRVSVPAQQDNWERVGPH